MAKVDKRRYSDRRQYLIRAVRARRKKIRQMAVDYKGGKCEVCGYNRCIDALEFHHKDLIDKKFGISEKGYTRSWKDVVKELGKCTIICANCHRELHAKLAAPTGNRGMKKRVNSGKARTTGSILSQAPDYSDPRKVQRLETRCLKPEKAMAMV
ncbi:MAG: hypothetical protein NTW09_05195 [Candidatus Omnitrophica bacterium]|nr:hypothetical protein [Candidatus Omnitrophota bacterium]